MDLRRHAEDWGQPFTPEAHVLVQEQSRSLIVGSMLRHPHKLEEIDMNYANIEERPLMNLSSAQIRKDDFISIINWTTNITKEEIKEAVKTYEEVEKSGLVDPKWLYQMEIGLNPFMIYQLRPFKMRQPVQNFALPASDGVDFPVITSDLAFGITPSDGVRLNFVAADFWEIVNCSQRILPKQGPYGLLLADRPRGSLPTDVMLGDLAVILSKSNECTYLEHGDYRLLKKSQFGLLNYQTENVPNFGVMDHEPQDLAIFSDSCFWSNGDRAVIIPAQYAEGL